MQSYQVFVDVGGPKTVCIYGGVSKGDQIRCVPFCPFLWWIIMVIMRCRELKQGVEIVVATPGRLIDLMHEGNISLQGALHGAN